MSIRRSNNAEIVDVEHKGQVISVRVALNANGNPRAILGKCSTAGREHYFVWAAGAMLSTKTHLTCRITGWTGWGDGQLQKPPQGTSVRMSDILLDKCFNGLQPPEVVLVVVNALNVYLSQSSPAEYAYTNPENMPLRKLERTSSPRSSTSQYSSRFNVEEELENLRKRVTDLEGRRNDQTTITPPPAWITGLPSAPSTPSMPSILNATSPVSMPPRHQINHFMSTVLCKPEDP